MLRKYLAPFPGYAYCLCVSFSHALWTFEMKFIFDTLPQLNSIFFLRWHTQFYVFHSMMTQFQLLYSLVPWCHSSKNIDMVIVAQYIVPRAPGKWRSHSLCPKFSPSLTDQSVLDLRHCNCHAPLFPDSVP